MTTWTLFTLAVVTKALPSDMVQLYANWVTAHADNVVTRAEVWLRMVANGGIPVPCDVDMRGGTPSYRTPSEREPRPARVLL